MIPGYPGPVVSDLDRAAIEKAGKTFRDQIGITPNMSSQDMTAAAGIRYRPFVDGHTLVVHPVSSLASTAYAEYFSCTPNDKKDRLEAILAIAFLKLHAPKNIARTGMAVAHYRPDGEPELIRRQRMWFAIGALVDDHEILQAYAKREHFDGYIGDDLNIPDYLLRQRLHALGIRKLSENAA